MLTADTLFIDQYRSNTMEEMLDNILECRYVDIFYVSIRSHFIRLETTLDNCISPNPNIHYAGNIFYETIIEFLN